MANYATLIAEIENYIKTNGEQAITGQILQTILKDIVDTLGNGFAYKGVATTDGTPGTPDNNVFYIAATAGTYTNYGAAVLDGNTLHILSYNGSWADTDTGIPSATAAANFAQIDGYYASLTAGAAENLVGRGSVPASFLRRTTGGSADVGTGTAKIAKLMGNSIVWNQLLNPPANSAAVLTNSVTQVAFDSETKICTLTGSGSVYFGTSGLGGASGKWISGHKYYMELIMSKTNADITVSIAHSVASSVALDVPVDSFAKVSGIVLAQFSTNGYPTIAIANLGENDNVQLVNNKMICVDLTKMFGAGKEPSTVAEFEALFPLDDYVNNDGEVIPFAAQKLVTTGFNQFNPATGIAKLLGGNKYQLTGTYTAATIDGVAVTLDAEDCFTPDADCELVITGGNETDTCVHLVWSGYRNGEFEPYELHEAIFDPANWEDANGNKIFPYGGMHGIGTARDFATPDNDGYIRKATRVFARVDLGTLTWSESSQVENGFVSTDGPVGMAIAPNGNITGTVLPAICARYIATSYNAIADKAMCYRQSAVIAGVLIKDSAFAGYTAEQVKAALSGVYLYYAVDTPVEIELAEPVAASYYANDFGTEEWQPANGDEPYTAPCELHIAYAMNAVDALRRLPENYISAASFENFCTELATKLGAALNKSITIAATYDAEDEEYDYAITIEDIEEG